LNQNFYETGVMMKRK